MLPEQNEIKLIELFKICSVCDIRKCWTEFHKRKSFRFNIAAKCKKCISVQGKVYCESHKKEIKAYKENYRKINKNKINKARKVYEEAHKKEISIRRKKHYQNNKEKLKQYCQDNKEKFALRIKQYYQDNKETIALKAKRYRQTEKGKAARNRAQHKRRALKRGVIYEIFNLKEIFERDGYICQHCGKKTRPDYNQYHPLYPELDHIVPSSKGGAHTRKNTQCLCRRCNNYKRNNNNGKDQLRMFG